MPRLPPAFRAIGHVCRDLQPGGGWQLGGAAYYAAATARRLGVERVGVLTSGPDDLMEALRAALPEVAVLAVPSERATCYENIYTPAGRRQYLRARAADLDASHLPAGWRAPRIALLAPLNQELAPSLAAVFAGALVGCAAQGWLRAWDEEGLISPTAFTGAIPPAVRALALSYEDLGLAAEEAIERVQERLSGWTRTVPLVVMTRGPEGALVLSQDEEPRSVAGYPARAVEPTGAGDVFATAFLIELAATDDAGRAADFANRVAALSTEQSGIAGIPTRAEVAARFGSSSPRPATL